MADKTYYAWAPIIHRIKDEGGFKNVNLNPGDKVPSDLLDSLDDETKRAWIHDGVIRTREYPNDVPAGLSVRTHLLRKANQEFERAQVIGNVDLDNEAQAVIAENQGETTSPENPQPVGETNKPATPVAEPPTPQTPQQQPQTPSQ